MYISLRIGSRIDAGEYSNQVSIFVPIKIGISMLLFLSLALSKNYRLHAIFLVVFVLEAILEVINRL